MTAEFRMGSPDAEHLSITVLGREYAGADYYWDGNWVVVAISVVVGGFTGQVRASLRMDEIHRFNEGLKSLHQNLSGAAVLESMEDWITLKIAAGPRGQITVSGELTDGAGAGNVLTFKLAEVDQTYLANWVSSLNDIEREYPVIGSARG